MNYLKYINPGIDSIKPYEPGKSVDDVTKKYNLDKIIKLASNENSLWPSPKDIDVNTNTANLEFEFDEGTITKINKINFPKLENSFIKNFPIFSINFIWDLNLMHFFQFPRIWYIYHQSITQSYQ